VFFQSSSEFKLEGFCKCTPPLITLSILF